MSEFQAWERAISRVTMHKAWPFPVSLHVRHSATSDAFDIRVTWGVNDIQHPDESIYVHMLEVVGCAESLQMDADEKVKHIIRLVTNAFRHEFDECLLVDGRKFRDPHANDAKK